MQQSIIVYRNPIEAFLWENNLVLPIFLGVVIAILLSVGLSSLLEKSKNPKLRRFSKLRKTIDALVIVVSLVTGVTVTLLLTR